MELTNGFWYYVKKQSSIKKGKISDEKAAASTSEYNNIMILERRSNLNLDEKPMFKRRSNIQ